MKSTFPRIGSRRVELSFDIYVLIIDLVANKNPLWRQCGWTEPGEDLKALSLTHRSLVAPCQKRLFETVHCSINVARKLLEIYDASPHLVNYARRLFYFSIGHRSNITDDTCEVMVAFISKFHNLSELGLGFHTQAFEAGELQRHWKNMDPPVAMALLALLRSQSQLETLGISEIKGFPLQGTLSMAKYRQHLKTLSIFSVTVDFTDIVQTADLEASNAVATGPGRLAKCNFGTGTPEVLSILIGSPDSPAKNHPILDFSSIEELSAYWKQPDDLAWTELLIQSSPYLHKFHLDLPKGSRMTFDGLAAAVLGGPSQNINDLRLTRNYIELEEINDDPFYGVDRELQRLSDGNVNALENLNISIGIYCAQVNTAIDGVCTTIAQQCKVLDMIVATEKAFPALRTLSICIVARIPLAVAEDLDFPDEILESLKQGFDQAAVRVKNACFKNLQTLSNLESFHFALEVDWLL